MGFDLHRLVDRLIDIASYDEPRTPDTQDESRPPPAEEDTENEEFVGENGPMNEELGEERIDEEDLREEPDQLSMNPKKIL